MRKLTRLLLPRRAVSYLARKQAEVNGGAEVSKIWERARQTKTMDLVYNMLARMVSPRSRCMYCGDSRGTDIDHFWPKVRYPARAFLWVNLLLVCVGCNRIKRDRFDLDSRGRPLLIDPTAEEPWDFLFFDSATGNITARYSADGLPSPKGQYTTSPDVLPLNIEAVTEGRLRTRRNLRRAVDRFCEHRSLGKDERNAQQELIHAIQDNDAYGLAVWYFLHDGQEESPFAELKARYSSIWMAVQEAIS